MTDDIRHLLPPPLQEPRLTALLSAVMQALAAMPPSHALHGRFSRTDDTTPHPAALWSLARQWSVTGWDGWNLAGTPDSTGEGTETSTGRRRLLAANAELHRHKGTPGGIRAALARLNLPGAVIAERPAAGRTTPHRHDSSRTRDGAIPYDGLAIPADRRWATFRVTLPGPELAAAIGGLPAVRASIGAFKRLSVHLVGLDAAMLLKDALPPAEAVPPLRLRRHLADLWLAGRRHDGTARRGGWRYRAYDGTRPHDGLSPRDGAAALPPQVQFYDAGAFPENHRILPRRRLADALSDGAARHDGSRLRTGDSRFDARRLPMADHPPRLYRRRGQSLEVL
jgi:hypothetical protein